MKRLRVVRATKKRGRLKLAGLFVAAALSSVFGLVWACGAPALAPGAPHTFAGGARGMA
jgi:hypothetical protein